MELDKELAARLEAYYVIPKGWNKLPHKFTGEQVGTVELAWEGEYDALHLSIRRGP